MQPYCFQIGSEIAQSPDAVQRAQFFGILTASEMHGSSTSAASACRVQPTQGDATHTDPQILFSAVAP